MVYGLSRDNRKFVVVDGIESKKYLDVSDPTFTPDSKHIVFFARNEDEPMILVVDDPETEGFAVTDTRLHFDKPNQVRFLAHKDDDLTQVQVTICEE